MAMLLFQVGDKRFALEAVNIFCIVPKVILKKAPFAESYFVGLLNYGGRLIPIIDLCQLIEQRPATPVLHSRIILLKDPDGKNESRVGLLGEKVGEIVNLKTDQFHEAEILLSPFPYLDKTVSDETGIIQYFNVDKFFQFLSFPRPES